MPKKLLSLPGRTRVLDARPDRLDLRDRMYAPRVANLPASFPEGKFISEHFPSYGKLILDQGKEGACTGYGLAACINYQRFRRHLERSGPAAGAAPAPPAPEESVSAAMLYHLARIYDEWNGEDYEGSSCRGAMKGWHRHGVCLASTWPAPRRGKKRVGQATHWPEEAVQLPIGAYYRVETLSVTDVQAAIVECGAVYASASVHKGWGLRRSPGSLPTISLYGGGKTRRRHAASGGHAFALVGYTRDGFIVQNSWGPEWGYHGFGVVSYEDWLLNATDAWVAALGAPMAPGVKSPMVASPIALPQRADTRAASWLTDIFKGDRDAASDGELWSEQKTKEHCLVFGNNGHLKRMLIEPENADAEFRVHAVELPLQWLAKASNRKLVIYAHGGLNSEEAALHRAAKLGPILLENGIYPLFYVWKSGLAETLGNILQEAAREVLGLPAEGPASGWLEELHERTKRWLNHLTEATDTKFEEVCQATHARGVWSEMKENAEVAARPGRGLNLLAQSIAELKQSHAKLEVHLIGHSAGAIVHGHLLQLLQGDNQSVASCHLFAPACTVPFALKTYAGVLGGILKPHSFWCHIMSDARERDDSVGPYRKSLLYLVSRALETVHKMPLLGLETTWNAELAEKNDSVATDHRGDVVKWRSLMAAWVKSGNLRTYAQSQVRTSRTKRIALAHGSFDNDIDVVTQTVESIRGNSVVRPIGNLVY